MKTLKDLQKEIEKETNTEFAEFPGKSRNSFYCPIKKDNPKSTRFWLTFKSTIEGNFCYFGDFAEDLKLKYKIHFNIDDLKKTNKEPKNDYRQQRELFYLKIKNLIKKSKIGNSPYLHKYKNIRNKNILSFKSLTIALFTSPQSGKVEALQYITKQGSKKFIQNSEVAGNVCIVKPPKTTSNLIYVTEGIKTACAVSLGVKSEEGVVCAGSLGNIRKAVQNLKLFNKWNNFILCSEKSSIVHYQKLSKDLNAPLVGTSDYEDLADYYEQTDLYCLKKILKVFKQTNYIPLGLGTSDNKIILYHKSLKLILEYKKTDCEILYADIHETSKKPNKEKALNLYFNLRDTCRKLGPVFNLKNFYTGIIPFKDLFLYYDQTHLYIIKDSKIIPAKIEDFISPSLLLTKKNNQPTCNLKNLKPLTTEELDYIFETLKLFTFSEPHDNKLIMGWIIQSLLTGGIHYRTPIWITAKSFSGKTQLSRRFLFQCFPYSERKHGRTTTPKWIPRAFDGKAIPLHREEFEPDPRKNLQASEELEFIRSSATERFPSRGISGGLSNKTIEFNFCLSALYTSIRAVNQMTSADFGRFVFFELIYKFAKNYEQKISAFESFMDFKTKNRFLLTCLLKLHQINREFLRLSENLHFSTIKTHKKSSVLMLLTCYKVIFNKPLSFRFIKEILTIKETKTFNQASKLFEDLLFLTIDKNKYNFLASTTLLQTLFDERFINFLNSKGFYIIRKTKLYIHKRLGVYFIFELLRDNKMPQSRENIHLNLQNDGNYLIKGGTTVGKLKNQILPRGEYFIFNLDLVKKELL